MSVAIHKTTEVVISTEVEGETVSFTPTPQFSITITIDGGCDSRPYAIVAPQDLLAVVEELELVRCDSRLADIAAAIADLKPNLTSQDQCILAIRKILAR